MFKCTGIKLGKVINLYTIIISLFFFLFPSLTYSSTLKTYISKVCKHNCINEDKVVDIILNNPNRKVDFRLYLALIKVESRFNVKATNGSSKGLMQVHTKIHKDKIAGKNIFKPSVNISIGMSIFNSCYKRYRNVNKSLKCYNGGGDKNYVVKVIKTYNKLLTLKTFKPTTFLTSKEKQYEKNYDICLWRDWNKLGKQVSNTPKGKQKSSRNTDMLRGYQLFEYRSQFG